MNFDLLRPFDLEAARKGAAVLCVTLAQEVQVVAGPDVDGMVILADAGRFVWCAVGGLRMAPLSWVEDKPVYAGDTLYCGAFVVIAKSMRSATVMRVDGERIWTDIDVDKLSWLPPKVPLAEVEGKPVFEGDELYYRDEKVKITNMLMAGALVFYNPARKATPTRCAAVEAFSWLPPKVKKTAWMNMYKHFRGSVHATRGLADGNARPGRTRCVEISWEE